MANVLKKTRLIKIFSFRCGIWAENNVKLIELSFKNVTKRASMLWHCSKEKVKNMGKQDSRQQQSRPANGKDMKNN